jgi:hypothetical protein
MAMEIVLMAAAVANRIPDRSGTINSEKSGIIKLSSGVVWLTIELSQLNSTE